MSTRTGQLQPKLDGFRALLAHLVDGSVHLTSRNQKDLARWFPEVLSAARCLPPGTLIDGELVVADERGYPDFGALQARLTVRARQVQAEAARRPAVLVAFDVLELAGESLLDAPLEIRRLERPVDGDSQDPGDHARTWLGGRWRSSVLDRVVRMPGGPHWQSRRRPSVPVR